MGVGVVHIVASVFTTYIMFTDEVRPPSSRKKRHQWLKWATGALLAVVAIWHALRPDTSADALLIVVLAVLAWHAFVGSKSIVRDLDMSRFMKTALRVAVVAVSVLIAVFVLVFIIAFNSVCSITQFDVRFETGSASAAQSAEKVQERLNGYLNKSYLFFKTANVDDIVAEICEEDGTYLKVVSVQKKFPNKVTAVIEEEYEQYAFYSEADNKYYVTDADGKVLAVMELPVAGIMAEGTVEEAGCEVHALEQAWEELGCVIPAPFMTMAFIPLACLPELRLTDRGLVDCTTFQFAQLAIEE